MGLLFESLFMNLVAVIVAISVAIYVFFKHRFGFWKRRGVVQLEPSFPFGNITDLFFGRRSFGEIFAQIYQELRGHPYGGIYRMFDPTLVLVDPEIIRKFMVKDFEFFRDRGFSVNEDSDPLMANLFFLGGPKWRHLRVKLSPTFTSGKMKMMFQKLSACTRELADVVSEMDGADVEIRDVLARYGTDVIGSIAFGLDVNSLRQPDHEFRVWGRRVFSSSPARTFVRFTKLFVPLDSVIRINNFPRDLTQYFVDMVRKTIECREKNNVSGNDFLQLLIQLKNQGYLENKSQNQDGPEEGHRRLTLEEVAAQAFIFFLAGFETTSTTISFCLHELTINTEIQARLQQEVDDVVSRTGGNITYEDIIRMPYLDMVVAETLRKYPPVPLLNRVCTTKYRLKDNLMLEKGTNVVIPLLGLHYDPKYYPDPERFDPNRFSEEEIAKRHHFTYMPFGEGPRICIGMRFGLLQTKFGIVSLLSRMTFSRCSKTKLPLVYDPACFVMQPKGGLWMTVNLRK